jgi:Putative Flp pilus-assembly TadE/G-like
MSSTATRHMSEGGACGKRRRRRSGLGRRLRKGQTLIIFALSFTVLLGMAGLTIDVARAYDLYARMQRAAEAGALAGVLYMPSYYDTPRPNDVDSAVSRASKEVVMDGFGSVLANSVSDCNPGAPVEICQVAGRSDDLQVIITQTFDVVLLSGLGVQPVTLSASASAEYLPPAQIGARLNYFGDQIECYNSTSNPDPTQTHSCSAGSAGELQSFIGVFNGPDELKENGDPYVYCEEGPSYTQPDTTTTYTAYNGDVTNHGPEYAASSILNHCGQPTGVEPGNPDQQPDGFTGEATKNTNHPGGYNFLLNVPQGIGNATLWVWNPSFIPSNSSTYDHFNGGSSNFFVGPNGTGIKSFDGYYDAPPFYYYVTYSLYSVVSPYDRSTDMLVGSPLVYPPYDAVSAGLSAHGCGSGQVYDPYWEGSSTPNSYNPPITAGQGCFNLATGTTGTRSPYLATNPDPYPNTQYASAPCWQAWCALFLSMPAGTYRLAIEATGLNSNTSAYSSNTDSGYGAHTYALKLCPDSAATPLGCSDEATGNTPGLQLAAWNNMDVYFTSGLSTGGPNPSDPSTTCVTQSSPTTRYTCLDVACIPTSYAGRTLSVQFYDPGDGSGDIYIGLAQAGVGTADVSYPGLTATYITTIDGDTVVHARFTSPQNYNAFNGIWLTASVTLPATYTGNCDGSASSTGWWQMIYASANGTPGDVVGVKLSLTGSPVHLLTLV